MENNKTTEELTGALINWFNLKDTAYVKVNGNSLEMDGIKVAEVKEFNDRLY